MKLSTVKLNEKYVIDSILFSIAMQKKHIIGLLAHASYHTMQLSKFTLVQFPVCHCGVVKHGPAFTHCSIVCGFGAVHLLSGSLSRDTLSSQ